MALSYGFFNSLNNDRLYNAEDIGRYLQGIISSGVYADKSSNLQVLSTGGMGVAVQAGRGMFDYHYLDNDEPYPLTLTVGSSLARYDAVVVRLDLTERKITLELKEGTPAATPDPPALTRTSTVKEYMLAKIYVEKMTTSITQGEITDTRADTSVCGWVTGVIDQVDTSTLFVQWQTAYEAAYAAMLAKIADEQAALDDFMAALTEDLNVLTYIQEYTNVVTLEAASATVTIGITDYDATVDVLLVNVGGLVWQKSGYTVNGTGSSATVTFTSPLKSGDKIEFRVLKSKIGSSALNDTLAAANDESEVLTDGGVALKL